MKVKYVILLTMLWMSVDVWSVKISRNIELADGRMVGSDHIFIDGDDCILTIDDPDEKVDWLFVLDAKGRTQDWEERGYNPISQLAQESSCAQLRMWGDVFKPYAYIYVNGYPSENDPSKFYNKGVVYVSRDGVKLDSMELKFDLLPPPPEVISGQITGDFDYDEAYYTDAVFTYKIKCPRATWLTMFFDLVYWWNPIPGPGELRQDSRYIYELDGSEECAIPTGDPSENIWTVIDSCANCDDVYVLYTIGKYGRCLTEYSYSRPDNHECVGDTIRVYDYITDPEILAALDRFRDRETGVSNVLEDPVGKIRLKGDNIVYSGDASQVETLIVTDLSGRIIKATDGDSSIDVSSLKKGVYIAVLTTRQRKTINHKFIIQ